MPHVFVWTFSDVAGIFILVVCGILFCGAVVFETLRDKYKRWRRNKVKKS